MKRIIILTTIILFSFSNFANAARFWTVLNGWGELGCIGVARWAVNAQGNAQVTWRFCYQQPAYYDNNNSYTLAQVKPEITAAFNTWQSACSDSISFTNGADITGAGGFSQDGINIVWFAPEDHPHHILVHQAMVRQGYPYWIAANQVFININKNIYEADIIFKDQVYSIGAGSNPDIQTVCLHEAGHFLGLHHTDDTNAIMYNAYGGLQHTLATDDVFGVSFLYGGYIIGNQTATGASSVTFTNPTYGLNWDWKVTNGATLTISNKTFENKANTKIRVLDGGNISFNTVTFKGYQDASWKGIELWNNQDLTLDYITDCTFEDAQVGVKFYNANGMRMNGNTIHDCQKGIEVVNSSNIKIEGSTIYNCSQKGISYVAPGGVFLKNNTIYDCGVGLYSTSTPQPVYFNVTTNPLCY